MRLAPLIVALIVLLAPGTLSAKDGPKKTLLKAVAKSFEKSDSKRIASHFPAKGKIELRLRGIKGGKYRNEQARSLLATFFKKIEPKKYKLKEIKSAFGTLEMKYKVKADGTVVEGKTYIYLEKEGESWLIVGIVES